jgi:hypothetical protein
VLAKGGNRKKKACAVALSACFRYLLITLAFTKVFRLSLHGVELREAYHLDGVYAGSGAGNLKKTSASKAGCLCHFDQEVHA